MASHNRINTERPQRRAPFNGRHTENSLKVRIWQFNRA